MGRWLVGWLMWNGYLALISARQNKHANVTNNTGGFDSYALPLMLILLSVARGFRANNIKSIIQNEYTTKTNKFNLEYSIHHRFLINTRLFAYDK